MLKPLFTLLALVLPLVACGDDVGTGPDGIAGTYTLRSVNGAALPATVIAAGPYRREVTAGEVTLEGNGTFSSSISFRETTSGVVTSQTAGSVGTYLQNQNALLLRVSNGQEFPGTLAGDVLTLEMTGDIYVFQK